MDNKIKRILFVITQSEFGGAQRFIYELTARLEKEKYEILVASDSGDKSDFSNSLEQKGVKTERLKFMKREVNPIFDCLGIIELMKLINNFKPDYLYLSSSKAGALGSIAAFKIKLLRPKKFKKLKVVYRIGGWTFNDPWPWWKKKIFVLAEKITAKLKDIIVVNNKNDFEQAIKLNIKPKKELKLIYNGIDALKIDFLPKDEALLKLSKKSAKTFQVHPHTHFRQESYDSDFNKSKVSVGASFIIGTIANFYQTKGLPYLIKTIKILKENFEKENIKFLVIGDGEERKNIERLIEETGLKNEVILAGQIPEAFKYIKAFDVFVLPSVKEGFPWVILDAMAAKLPIIATSVGALPEIIENGRNGILVEPKNPHQLAEAIKYLMENEHARQEFSLHAHQTVLFKFPIEKMVRETEELFD